MNNYNELIKEMGITFEENMVDNDDFESSFELKPIQELLNVLEKGDI